MKTNYEYLLEEHKDIIKECLVSAQSIYINKDTGEIGKCYRGDKCKSCKFGHIDNCYGKVAMWLEEEYKPVPTWMLKDGKATCTSCGMEVDAKDAFDYIFCPRCGEKLIRKTT